MHICEWCGIRLRRMQFLRTQCRLCRDAHNPPVPHMSAFDKNADRWTRRDGITGRKRRP
jgi:enoyl reductase-like protein